MLSLSRGVERFAELHDVDAALAQCRTHRRTRVSLSRWDLQLDFADDFLRHGIRPFWLVTFHLDELKFDRCCPSEDTNQYSELPLVGLDLLHNAVEIGEGSIDHLHVLAHGE